MKSMYAACFDTTSVEAAGYGRFLYILVGDEAPGGFPPYLGTAVVGRRGVENGPAGGGFGFFLQGGKHLLLQGGEVL